MRIRVRTSGVGYLVEREVETVGIVERYIDSIFYYIYT